MESNELKDLLALEAKKQEEVAIKLKASEEALELAKKEISSNKDEVVKLGTEVAKMKEDKKVQKESKVKSIVDVISEKSEGLESLAKKSSKNRVEFEVKATADYGDIDAGLDFAPMRSGITDIVKKQPVFVNLFPRINFQGEFYKYAEQETVTRNAQNVATCTAVTSTTGETIKTQNISTKKIKDTLKFCSDYANDYGFVQGRLQALIR